MWLCTVYGFFSAVCARSEPSHQAPVDPDRIMVRARMRIHLEKLQARFRAELAEYPIVETDADYRYRMFVPKRVWAAVVTELTLETDYDNFKERVHQVWGRDDGGYSSALGATWSTFNRLQR